MATSQSSRIAPIARQSTRNFSSTSSACGRVRARPAYRSMPTIAPAAVKLRQNPVVPPASPEVMRKLVSLHHAAASFMHEPTAAGQGFDNAYQHTSTEASFTHYDQWARRVLRGHHSTNEFIPRERGIDDDFNGDRRPARLYHALFKDLSDMSAETRNAMRERDRQEESEREKEVREVLFGTWERGGVGIEKPRPSYDGLMEWLKKRDTDPTTAAHEWVETQEDLVLLEERVRLAEEAEAQEAREAEEEERWQKEEEERLRQQAEARE